MPTKIILLLSTLFSFILNSQDDVSKTTNPIIYADLFAGGGTGFGVGGTINYQVANNLFTFRFIENKKFNATRAIILPNFETNEINKEFAVMYGKRKVLENFSYNYSVGISLNKLEEHVSSVEGSEFSTVVGLPFEFTVQWFKAKKSKYRVYYVIPVGSPTGLSNSFGFKLYGNISNGSYLGVGLVFGLGYYKKY